MINVAITYDPTSQQYKIYEGGTNTLMVSANLSEGLVLLNKFLLENGLIAEHDLLQSGSILYHLDSATMTSIIQGNVELIKRMRSAPGGFALANQRFGGTGNGGGGDQKKKTSSSGFQGATGFKQAYKKFGYGGK